MEQGVCWAVVQVGRLTKMLLRAVTASIQLSCGPIGRRSFHGSTNKMECAMDRFLGVWNTLLSVWCWGRNSVLILLSCFVTQLSYGQVLPSLLAGDPQPPRHDQVGDDASTQPCCLDHTSSCISRIWLSSMQSCWFALNDFHVHLETLFPQFSKMQKYVVSVSSAKCKFYCLRFTICHMINFCANESIQTNLHKGSPYTNSSAVFWVQSPRRWSKNL